MRKRNRAEKTSKTLKREIKSILDVTQDEERLRATTRSALIREGPFQIKPKKQQIEYTNINCIRFTHTHHDVASNGAKTGTQN